MVNKSKSKRSIPEEMDTNEPVAKKEPVDDVPLEIVEDQLSRHEASPGAEAGIARKEPQPLPDFNETKLPPPARPEFEERKTSQPLIYSLNCNIWTSCPHHSIAAISFCRACRMKQLREGNQVRVFENGEGVFSMSACADCIRRNIENENSARGLQNCAHS